MSTPATPPDHLFAGFVALLLDTLAQMVPGNDNDPNARTARRNIARILFDAFKPGDAIEAALAARAVAAHHATMDGYARAAQSGVSDERAIRLRGSAIAASRSFDVVLRTLEKLRKPSPQPLASAAKFGNATTSSLVSPSAVKRQSPATTPGLPPHIPGLPQGNARPASYRDSTSLSSMQRTAAPAT
jgi:hypothetical protein